MPRPPGSGRGPLTRADLPDQLNPETIRGLDIRTIKRLSQHNNGVLSAEDQRVFDDAVRVVMQDNIDRLDASLRRTGRGAPRDLDPDLRRSYQRTRARLAEQARRAQESFPQLTAGWEGPAETTGTPTPTPPQPTTSTALPPPADEPRDDVSLGSFETEIEQTSDTLDILERIASIEQQQLEHQRGQVLRDVRGVFFAFLVSIAVIVAGVAPLVEASADDRKLILLWTLVICVFAGLGYAVVRFTEQRRRKDQQPPSG